MLHRRILLVIIPAIVFTATHSTRAGTESPTPSLPDTLMPYQRVLDNDQLQTVETLEKQIVTSRAEARYADAIPLAEKIVTIRQAAQGDDHWETGDAHRLLNTLHYVAGLSPEDQAKLAEADRSDDEVCRLFAEGDLEATGELIQHSLALRRELLGDEHIEVAIAIDDLASVLWKQGEVARAELLFRQSLVLNRRILRSDHPNLARAMNNLAVVCLHQGNPGTELLQQEALNINRRILGDLHPHTITDVSNLGVTRSMQDPDRGISLLKEAVSLARKSYGEKNPNRLRSLYNLIDLYHRKYDQISAKPLINEALTLSTHLPDKHNDLYSSLLYLQCTQHMLNGDFQRAESFIRQTLSIDTTLGRTSHIDVVKDRYRLAHLLHLQGNFAAAETAWASACESFRGARLRTSINAFDRLKIANSWSVFDYFATCLVRRGKYRGAWEQLEAHSARGLVDEIATRDIRSLTPSVRKDRQTYRDTLAVLDEQINSLRKTGDSSPETAGIIDSLLLIRDDRQCAYSLFEEQIADRYGDNTGEAVDLDHLQSHMNPDQAFITWIDIEGAPYAPEKNGEHWVCVVRSDDDPQWFSLYGSGENGEWTAADDSLSIRLRNYLRKYPGEFPSNDITDLRERMYRQRIAPAEDVLHGIRHLIILPGGWMMGIPVEALTDEYTVSYTPSATIYVKMIRSRDQSVPDRSLLAVGDPILGDSLPSSDTTMPDSIVAELRSGAFRPLPGTRLEVNMIAEIFSTANHLCSPVLLVGSDAREQLLSETAAKDGLSSFGYLHFATHAVMDNISPLQSALILSREDYNAAMERALQGENIFDGMITAEQILRTWRLDADLVVLSACETALGKYFAGEGFLGFSQAFFAVGARSLLLSLWKVEDTATSMLMSRFYQNLIGTHGTRRTVAGRIYDEGIPLPKVDALAEAKTWLRELTWEDPELATVVAQYVSRGLVPVNEPPGAPSSQHPFADPRYWAAFILMGDPW